MTNNLYFDTRFFNYFKVYFMKKNQFKNKGEK